MLFYLFFGLLQSHLCFGPPSDLHIPRPKLSLLTMSVKKRPFTGAHWDTGRGVEILLANGSTCVKVVPITLFQPHCSLIQRCLHYSHIPVSVMKSVKLAIVFCNNNSSGYLLHCEATASAMWGPLGNDLCHRANYGYSGGYGGFDQLRYPNMVGL